MPRTQTLDAQTHHKRGGDKEFTRFDKMPTSLGQKREISIDIHKITRGILLVL